jgi:amphiphysin
MLNHQIEYSKSLAEIYKPISGRPSDPNSYKDEGNPEGIRACEQYEEVVKDLQQTLAPELETVETRIVGPANELLQIMKQIRKTAVKRDHKQLDFDRHSATLKKLQDKKDKTIKDEKAIFKAEADVEQATQDFNHFNELLKTELPKFFDLEREFIKPLFQSLYFLQLNIFYTMHERMQNLDIGYFDFTVDVEAGFEKRFGDMKEQAEQLSILHFKKTGGLKKTGESKYAQKGKLALEGSRPSRSNTLESSETPPPPYSAAVSTTSPPTSAGLVNSAGAIAAAKAKGPAPPPPKPKPPRLSGAPAHETVTALYDYEAQAHGDLSFSAGEVIEIVRRTDNVNEWWIGKSNGKEGQFPGKHLPKSCSHHKGAYTYLELRKLCQTEPLAEVVACRGKRCIGFEAFVMGTWRNLLFLTTILYGTSHQLLNLNRILSCQISDG